MRETPPVTLSEADCASSSVRFMRLCSAFSLVCSSSSPPEEKRSVMSATIWPTMPPTSVCVPAGMTSPSTVRFRTDAPLSTRLKRPHSEQLSVRRRPVILCPCPSKSPRKIGIEAAAPSASMSSVSTTVSPLNRYPRRSAWQRPAADAESRWRRFRSAASAIGHSDSTSTSASRAARMHAGSLFFFMGALLQSWIFRLRAVRDASGDDAQVDVAVDAGADKATDRAADLTGHKADAKHTLARLVRPRGGGHGDAGLIRQSAAEQQNLRQNEQHEQH